MMGMVCVSSVRNWMWVDYVLASIRFVYYGFGIIYFISNPDEIGMSPLFFYLWFTLCMIIPHLFWRPGYIHDVLFSMTELFLLGSFHMFLIFYLEQPLGISLLIMPALIIGFIARKQALIFGTIALILLAFCNFYLDPRFLAMANNLLILFMLYIFGVIFNRLLHTQVKMKQLLEDNQQKTAVIEAQNKALEQYSSKVEELTLVAERNRIAGELHDTIGHTFTSVIVGMDAVMYLMDTSVSKAKERLAVLREVTKNGLDQLREQIHDMAADDENLSISSKLEKIAMEFSEYTNTDVSIHTSGPEVKVTRSVSLALSRCLQEALTNAKRHGKASKINVIIKFTNEAIQLLIQDNGIGCNDLQFGFGLQTMQERLSMVNGSLTIGSELNGGTLLTCHIRLKEDHYEQNKAAAGR